MPITLQSLHQLSNNPQVPNLFFSPFGIEVVLALAISGTTGKVRDGLLAMAGITAAEEDVFLEAVQHKVHSLLAANDGGDLVQLENRLLGQGLPLKQDWLDWARSNFQLESETEVPVQGPLNDAVQFALENELLVQAKWVHRFEDVPGKTAPFYLVDGTPVEALTMAFKDIYWESEMAYLKKDTFHAMRLPCETDRFCMEVYLPYERDGLPELLALMTPDNLESWHDAFEDCPYVEIQMPKFEFNAEHDLKALAIQLGLGQIFDAGHFHNRMFQDSEPAMFYKFNQTAKIKVNELGFMAHAITELIGMVGSGMPEPHPYVRFIANHPFVFLVKDKLTNTILFQGTFTQPEDPEQAQRVVLFDQIYRDIKKYIQQLGLEMMMAYTATALTWWKSTLEAPSPALQAFIDSCWQLACAEKEQDRRERSLEFFEWDQMIARKGKIEKVRLYPEYWEQLGMAPQEDHTPRLMSKEALDHFEDLLQLPAPIYQAMLDISKYAYHAINSEFGATQGMIYKSIPLSFAELAIPFPDLAPFIAWQASDDRKPINPAAFLQSRKLEPNEKEDPARWERIHIRNKNYDTLEQHAKALNHIGMRGAVALALWCFLRMHETEARSYELIDIALQKFREALLSNDVELIQHNASFIGGMSGYFMTGWLPAPVSASEKALLVAVAHNTVLYDLCMVLSHIADNMTIQKYDGKRIESHNPTNQLIHFIEHHNCLLPDLGLFTKWQRDEDNLWGIALTESELEALLAAQADAVGKGQCC